MSPIPNIIIYSKNGSCCVLVQYYVHFHEEIKLLLFFISLIQYPCRICEMVMGLLVSPYKWMSLTELTK